MFFKLETNRKFKNNTISFINIIDETILLGLGKINSKTWNSLSKERELCNVSPMECLTLYLFKIRNFNM